LGILETRGGWTRLVQPTWPNAALHLAIYLGLALLYIAALRLLTPPAGSIEASPSLRRAQFGIVFAVWLACSGISMQIAPNGESHDIFDYLFRGRMMAEYGGNPLADIPKSYAKAPFFHYLAWYRSVDTYGPLWEMASAGVAVGVRQTAQSLGGWAPEMPSCPVSPDSCRLLTGYLTGYRLLAVILAGLSGGLVVSLVNRSRPSHAPAALAAWLWCPVTVFASAVGGHNDLLMLALLLLGAWLLRRNPFWALVALILAAHVKLTALIWLPVFALWILRRWGWRPALRIGLASILAGLGVSWLLYAPFGGWGSLPPMVLEGSLYLTNSVWRLFYNLFYNELHWPKELARRLTIDLPTGLFAAGALLIPAWMFNFRPARWRKHVPASGEDERQLWVVLAAASLLYLAIGSYWFQHWYLLWVLAAAALIPDGRFTRSVLPWLSFGALSANVLVDFLLAILPVPLPAMRMDFLTVATIWGPGLVAALAAGLLARTWLDPLRNRILMARLRGKDEHRPVS